MIAPAPQDRGVDLIIHVKQGKDSIKLALKENGLAVGQTEGKEGS